MSPYRAQMGGIFGSGLYPKQPQQDNAGMIIDAVTRGASTLIESAYARRLAQQQRAQKEQEMKLQQRTADRADAHDAWEKEHTAQEDARKNRAEERADFESGYTPAKTTTTDVLQPGSVESNGLLGAPGKITGPSIREQQLTIPAAYDYSKSKAGRTRAEHVTDSEAIHNSNRQYDVANPLPPRARAPGTGTGGTPSDSRAVHASTAVRAQINETNQRIKLLQAKKFAPGVIAGDDERQAANERELAPLIQKRDSLSGVNDRIAGKLTEEAGIGGTRGATIKGALGNRSSQKTNGSTIRGGGEASGETPARGAAKKSSGETVRHPGKEVITRAEADSLIGRGFSEEQLRKKYLIQ